MTRLGDLSGETLAVEAIASDIALLEAFAACGGELSPDDMALLTRCKNRLSRLLPALAAPDESARHPVEFSGRELSSVTTANMQPLRQSEDAA